ncbi:hypothetical protein [Marinivivus vitaminiproducens]|uniref:hypothetical protein n=1 Tax=Marinivivus vitaminiproducens TaxID=3035935 RepID=UPI0027A84AA2|nr:hypothetical protein P4R82_17830 [Geminicoccaceae bacterium SCSIO 64248]
MTKLQRRGRRGCLLGGLALLSACASSAEVARPPQDQARVARVRLEDAASQGPVLLEVHGNAFGQSETARNAGLVENLSKGVRYYSVAFTTDPAQVADKRLRTVAVLNPLVALGSQEVCNGNAVGDRAIAPGRVDLLLVSCDETRPLASARGSTEATGPDDDRYARLIWQTADALYPDDYDNRYGFGWFPGVNIGAGVGVGSGGGTRTGVGVGLGF